MRFFNLLLAQFPMMLLAFAMLAGHVLSTPPTTEVFKAAMQKIVEAKAAKYNCSVALGLRWGDLSLEVAGGETDRRSGRKALPDDVYVWGSITKTFTGPAVMQLIDQGVLSLDDNAAPLIDKLLFRLSGI
jgi:CubicO group peptidase (beta-lactamase class C family)